MNSKRISKKTTKKSSKRTKMRNTTILEKLFPSIINGALALAISYPILYTLGPTWEWKVYAVGIFYIIQLLTVRRKSFRCFGMTITNSHWGGKYTNKQKHIFIILYTLSFSTVLFWVVFPFDLLAINIVLQLLAILTTGTTLHGWLAGGLKTKKHA